MSTLKVGSYRSFATLSSLRLRPMTLLYGPNNAGKSALLRTLPILSASIDPRARGALVMPDEVARGGEFADLHWRGEPNEYQIQLHLEWENCPGLLRAEYTLDGGPGRPSWVRELSLIGPGDVPLWHGEAPSHRPMTDNEFPIGFDGLVPRESNNEYLNTLRKAMVSLRDSIFWLESVRTRPPREVKPSGGRPVELSPNGAEAAVLLADNRSYLSDIAKYYASLEPRRHLRLQESEARYRLLLDPDEGLAWSVALAETGEGMNQVFPVLVAAAHARSLKSAVLAVEEPEAHLHPDAQRRLAEHFCRFAALPGAPAMVFETHSRVFLLGVQLAVASGILKPERVQIVWIDQDSNGTSRARSVELDAGGHPTGGWPRSALGEDLRLARELLEHDLKRGR